MNEQVTKETFDFHQLPQHLFPIRTNFKIRQMKILYSMKEIKKFGDFFVSSFY